MKLELNFIPRTALAAAAKPLYTISSMQHVPTEIRRLGETGVKIKWADGTTHEIASEILRRCCPCASCREKEGDTSHSKPLTGSAPKKKSLLKVIEHTLDEELKLTQIWAIGNYAIGAEWGDGHNSGIYSYQYLYEIGESASRHQPNA